MQLPQSPQPEKRSWFNFLSVRVAIFLSLALLPLGLLAVLQTRDLTREVRNRSELSLLALTEYAASSERQMIERGIGAAEALSAVLRMIREDPTACSTYLKEYLASTQRYVYVGFVPSEGPVRCASSDYFSDLSQGDFYADLKKNPRQVVAPYSETWDASGSSVVIYNPVMAADVLLGFTVISVMADRLRRQEDFGDQSRPLGLLTFNADGMILTAEDPQLAGKSEIPRNRALAPLAGTRSATFYDQNQNGDERLYVKTEIVPGVAFALGVWDLSKSGTPISGMPVPASLFPLLMWLASLLVAIFAVHRLAVRHLQRLGATMRRFALDRKIPDHTLDVSQPYEVQQLEHTFRLMAYGLLADEARMEDALREKHVLLKEVHHRVKNNLQMISSIMNMTIRKTNAIETKATIRRLQERVLGLATVHRNLYQTEDLTKINAGALLREVFTQLLAAKKSQGGPNLQIKMDIDDITMFPDQAVPFSLLASEVATNSLNHVGCDEGAEPWISFDLHKPAADKAMLVCRNSVGPKVLPDKDLDDQGLGAQLIKAFSMQLGATYDVEEKSDEYIVTVAFVVQDFKPEAQDY